MRSFFCAAAAFLVCAALSGCGSQGAPVIDVNFEGIVSEVNGSRITLEGEQVILIDEKTAFPTEYAPREFLPGNFVQGHTADNPSAGILRAGSIYVNIQPEGILAKLLINFEGTVTAIDGNSLTLDNGQILLLTEDTVYSIHKGIVKHCYPHVGSYVQGFTPDDPGAKEITADRLHTVFF